MKKILIFVLVLLVLSAGGFALYRYLNPYSDEPPVSSTPAQPEVPADRFFCEYHVYGGMNDENYLLSIERQPDGTLLFTHTEKEFISGEETTETCIVPESAAEKLTCAFENCGAFDWGELPDKAYEIIDAASVSLKIELADKSFSVTDEKELPRNGRNLFNDVHNIMKSYIAWKSE